MYNIIFERKNDDGTTLPDIYFQSSLKSISFQLPSGSSKTGNLFYLVERGTETVLVEIVRSCATVTCFFKRLLKQVVYFFFHDSDFARSMIIDELLS